MLDYNPKKIDGYQVVEGTYMVDEKKIVVHVPVCGQCVGYFAINWAFNGNSDWIGDLDQVVETQGVEGIAYDAVEDVVTLILEHNATIDIPGEQMADYLVKTEIVEVKNEEQHKREA